MLLNIHSDASYLSEPQAHSHVSGNFFLGDTPAKGQLIVLNGKKYVFCGILKFVMASAAEADLGSLILKLQGRTNNSPNPGKNLGTSSHLHQCTVIISQPRALLTTQSTNNSHFQWKCVSFGSQSKLCLGRFDVLWHPGQEN